jgi:adenylate kinase family enzyme
MYRPFVLISGLPASGKSLLGRRLAPALDLPLIDKDDILEHLFELRGAGDKEWRRMLSRESDIILQREAMSSGYHRLHAAWSLNFHLDSRPLLLSIPSALGRVEIQFRPMWYAKRGEIDRDQKAEIEAPRGIKPVVS